MAKGRYDAMEVEYGVVYRWCPDCAVVQCECGAKHELSLSSPECPACGTDQRVLIRHELDRLVADDKLLHPWRYAVEREGLPI